MRNFAAYALGTVLLVGACAAPSSAEIPAGKRAEAEAFALNNVTSSLYHEFGHLLIDQFEWPVLGREENAADTIMTMLLLDEDTEEAALVAMDAVRGYIRSSVAYGETKPENLDLQGEHELELQRGFLMACILVGSDRDTFKALADEIGLGDNRIESCREDARLAERSWRALKAQNSSDENEDRGARLTVAYEDAGQTYGAIAEVMKRERLLERVAETLTTRFALKRDASMKAALCGDDDAYYNGSSNEITLCYEYVQFYHDLIADPENAGKGMI